MNTKNIVLALISFGIFTNLFYYLPYAKILNIPGYLIYIVLFLFLFYYYTITKKQIFIDKFLFMWVIFYFSLSAIYIMATGFGTQEFKFFIPVIMVFPIFISLSLLYNLDDENLSVTRNAIVVAIIIGSILLIIDFLFPGNFVTTRKTIERSVATYGNSNIAGAVLILGMILTIDIVKKKYQGLYISLIFLGILSTFSRSNIMLLILILFLMSIQNKISKKMFYLFGSFMFIFMSFLIFGGLTLISDIFNIHISENLISRLFFFIDIHKSNLTNISERELVLKAALELFYDKPILGNGFAATRLWEYPVGPHNTFALTWAEFGLFGMLIIPSFLYMSTYSIFKSGNKNYIHIAYLYIVYYVFSSIFSHNMLDQGFNLAGAVLITILGFKNLQIKQKGIKKYE